MFNGLQGYEIEIKKGKIHFIEKTLDYFFHYCQKNQTFMTPVVSKFFTILDKYVWALILIISLIVRVIKIGGLSDIFCSILKQPIPQKYVHKKIEDTK